ncbi:basic leucine zipper transcriptional factor ATF-like 2 isoform X1 [Notamacropus eugenii]|uniref:basic leucine zipper transcriptional factor ATF-like 2 isoform X1 n=1 Tax=Notamacropus eugenii TaxID=9315 RepID=UPI003B68075A
MHLCSGAPPSQEGQLLLVTDPREVDRQLKRRQKNRTAAQRSRQKHTHKADELHQIVAEEKVNTTGLDLDSDSRYHILAQRVHVLHPEKRYCFFSPLLDNPWEHEWLERDNQALQKEIQSLQVEMRGWLQALEEHQRVCLLAVGPASAQTHPDCWRQTEPAPQTSQAGQHTPVMVQTLPTPLQAPASPSAQPPLPSSPVQAPDPPGLLSASSLSSPLTPFLVTSPLAGSPSGATVTQTHGPSNLLASSPSLSPHFPAPPQQSACLPPLGARNLRENRTENMLGSPSATPNPGESRQGWAWVLSSAIFDPSSVIFP